jgi:phospholipase C
MKKLRSTIPVAALALMMSACGSSGTEDTTGTTSGGTPGTTGGTPGTTGGTTGGTPGGTTGGTTGSAPDAGSVQDKLTTATPIKHLVVIFGENISFDHYFATYPTATNVDGEPAFNAASGTPTVNGLSGSLLTSNPNSTNSMNAAGATNPFRLDRAQANTADMNHGYTAEQQAYDNGLSDLFPLYTGSAFAGGAGAFGTTGLVMGYFDGNTVTGLWNYAQRFAMSDNSYGDMYGPSTVGAINVISGQTNDITLTVTNGSTSYWVDDGQGGKTLMGDVDPANDTCSSTTEATQLNGKSVGDLLTTSSVTWGAFQGGFDLTVTNPN